MSALSIIDRILGIGRILKRAVDDNLRENAERWGEFASENPAAAAAAMERIAVEIEAAHDALKPRRRLIRRRLKARELAYRAHAQDLYRYSRQLPCRHPLRSPGA